ncbi:salicylic acid-binding protein 2-like [Phoenix dactylifera]|uniref:Salicylic acid-binding protein 2-like n=1 Tax=Phoenix dactylifera TaxID=42345 RepID=A0A8B9AD03_PHODC|nr:salicylic acid-binding protein 2-like [Phoenix dactylifera]
MEEDGRRQKHIILVHGACHGAWSWYKVATLLRCAGHQVTVPDLAASGIDERRLHEVPTFADYSQPLLDIMAALPPGERVILVGHSLGGLSVALAMESFPERIAAAVFLAAFMPAPASRPSHILDEFIQQAPMSYWMDTQFSSSRSQEKSPTSMLFGPQFMSLKLYQLCSTEDLTLGMTLVRVGSLFHEDLSSAPPFSKGRYGSVDVVYIICCQDLGITKDFQHWMIKNNPVKEVKVIEEADHMAMLSRPKELCKYLSEVIDTYA